MCDTTSSTPDSIPTYKSFIPNPLNSFNSSSVLAFIFYIEAYIVIVLHSGKYFFILSAIAFR